MRRAPWRSSGAKPCWPASPQLRALEERAAAASAKSKPVFDKRGQLLPRERVALLLDAGTPYLPLCSLAGYLQDIKDPAASVPGGGIVAGIGFVSGVRCMVVASDSGIDAGAIQPMGLDKILRVQEMALREQAALHPPGGKRRAPT